MPLNQFGQRPKTTSVVINGDVWSVDTRSVQLTHRCHCTAEAVVYNNQNSNKCENDVPDVT